MKKYWFKSKHYGWGWYPSSWQGWLVTLTAVFAMITVGVTADQSISAAYDVLLRIVAPILGIACVLIFIAWRTGEKPRWRWGDDD